MLDIKDLGEFSLPCLALTDSLPDGYCKRQRLQSLVRADFNTYNVSDLTQKESGLPERTVYGTTERGLEFALKAPQLLS